MGRWFNIFLVTIVMLVSSGMLTACGDDEKSDGMPEEFPNNEDE